MSVFGFDIRDINDPGRMIEDSLRQSVNPMPTAPIADPPVPQQPPVTAPVTAPVITLQGNR